MYYVYILRSKKTMGAIYVGYTNELKTRVLKHNSETSYFSKRNAPWEIETYFAFSSIKSAKDFERYLKSGSGRAFLKKRLVLKDFKEALAKYNNGRMTNSP